MKIRTLCLSSLLLLQLSCGINKSINTLSQSSAPKIIGGVNVDAKDIFYHSTVSLVDVRPTKEDSLCSGTLIAEDVVVTASHCVEQVLKPIDWPEELKKACPGDYSPMKLEVAFGSPVLIGEVAIKDPFEVADTKRTYKLNPNITRRKIKKIFMHENFSLMGSGDPNAAPKVGNDVAVIILAEKAPDTAYVMPVLQQRQILTPNAKVTVAGYGVNWGEIRVYNDGSKCAAPMGMANTSTGHGTLRKRDIQLKSVRQGSKGNELLLTEGTCWGDSGGPTYIFNNGQYYVTGASSRSEGIAANDKIFWDKVEKGLTAKQPACKGNNVYTDISSYYAWINQKVKQVTGRGLESVKTGWIKTGSTKGDGGDKELPTQTSGSCPKQWQPQFECQVADGCAIYADIKAESKGYIKSGIKLKVSKHACQTSTRDIWVYVDSSKGSFWVKTGEKF